MITASCVNSIGLVFDIVGALLLWRYGLPEPISKTGAIHMIAEQSDQSEIDRAKRFDRWAHAGIALIVLGFLLQLISNYLQ